MPRWGDSAIREFLEVKRYWAGGNGDGPLLQEALESRPDTPVRFPVPRGLLSVFPRTRFPLSGCCRSPFPYAATNARAGVIRPPFRDGKRSLLPKDEPRSYQPPVLRELPRQRNPMDPLAGGAFADSCPIRDPFLGSGLHGSEKARSRPPGREDQGTTRCDVSWEMPGFHTKRGEGPIENCGARNHRSG